MNQNAAAKDLWKQLFERLAMSEMAALVDPEYDPSDDEIRRVAGFKAAGWTDEEILKRTETDARRLQQAPITSPGVNPSAELFLEKLCNDVEAAMGRLNLRSQHGVARGVEPVAGFFAANTKVAFTDEGIVTMGAHSFRFCGLIGKALARTVMINPALWEAKGFDIDVGSTVLQTQPALIIYWLKIFLSYASTGTNILVPFKPATKSELGFTEQIARAMELFALSHEYGHHHLGHGKNLEVDPHREEFDADQFALRVCYEVERKPEIYLNPYLSSGAGGMALLMSLETLRGVSAALGMKVDKRRDTHPDIATRINRFDSVAVLKPEEFTSLKAFRTTCERIMSTVNRELSRVLSTLPEDALEPFRKLAAA